VPLSPREGKGAQSSGVTEGEGKYHSVLRRGRDESQKNLRGSGEYQAVSSKWRGAILVHALPESFRLQNNIGARSTCKLQVYAVYIYIYIYIIYTQLDGSARAKRSYTCAFIMLTTRTKNIRGSGEQQRNLSRSVPDRKMNGCQCAAVPKEHLLKKDCSEWRQGGNWDVDAGFLLTLMHPMMMRPMQGEKIAGILTFKCIATSNILP